MKLKLLDQAEASWSKCERCDLAANRRRVVAWRGDPSAKLFVIGDGPGTDEDEQGRPFVGPAGRVLDELLKRAGLQPSDVFITYMVGCRLPGLRMPEQDELKACAPRLQLMMRIVKPRALLLLGSTPARLAGATSVSASRGRPLVADVLCYDGEVRSWPAVVTWSPPFLMRSGLGSERFQEALSDVQCAWKIAQFS